MRLSSSFLTFFFFLLLLYYFRKTFRNWKPNLVLVIFFTTNMFKIPNKKCQVSSSMELNRVVVFLQKNFPQRLWKSPPPSLLLCPIDLSSNLFPSFFFLSPLSFLLLSWIDFFEKGNFFQRLNVVGGKQSQLFFHFPSKRSNSFQNVKNKIDRIWCYFKWSALFLKDNVKSSETRTEQNRAVRENLIQFNEKGHSQSKIKSILDLFIAIFTFYLFCFVLNQFLKFVT